MDRRAASEAEIEAAAKAIEDLKLTFEINKTQVPLHLDHHMRRLIAMAALHAAQDIRDARQEADSFSKRF